MNRLLGRQAIGYGLGVLTAVAGFGAAAAWAGHSATGETISACQEKNTGVLYIPAKETKFVCKKHDTPVEWSITGPVGPKGDKGDKGDPGATGPPGPAGTFTNAKSPNGIFSVSLSNSGIVLKGPNGRVVVDFGGAHTFTVTGG